MEKAFQKKRSIRLESDIRYYSRRFNSTFKTAKGSWIFDVQGARYLDFLCGAGALNYGHNHPLIKSKLIQYFENDGIIHSLDMDTEVRSSFISKLNELVLAPRGLNFLCAFPGPTGTNAIELALKIVRHATGRRRIVGFTGGFHGVTLGSLAVSASMYHRQFAGVSLNETIRLPYDGYMGANSDSLVYIEKMLQNHRNSQEMPAAFVVETIQGEGGINVASRKWLRGLQNIANENNILLILDEIQTGCGRTGSFFGFEQANLSPDVVCLSKSLSGYGLPLSLVLLKPGLDLIQPGGHNGTFRGFSPAFLTATASLEIFWSDNKFENEIIRKGKLLESRINNLTDNYNISYKGIGLFSGLEFHDSGIAKAVADMCFKNKILVETSGPNNSVVKLFPALNISDEILMYGIDILERVVKQVL